MSEYQYDEFQAVDRPLTKDEMTEVFRTRLVQFRERHARKPSLQARLQKAQLDI